MTVSMINYDSYDTESLFKMKVVFIWIVIQMLNIVKIEIELNE